MGLLDEHVAERRIRILAAARKLVAKRGYDGLTMRELAKVARVSVPTLYNQFGSKDAILAAELAQWVGRAAVRPSGGGGVLERMTASFEAGMAAIAEDPDFFRELIHLFLTSPEAAATRRQTEDGFLAVITANLEEAKAAGELVDWAEPRTLATHMLGLHLAAFLKWGGGELELEAYRLLAASGAFHVLLGVARGRFADELATRARALGPLVAALTRKEPSDAADPPRTLPDA